VTAVSTSLYIDEKLLKRAQELGGHSTKRAAVNEALREYVQRRAGHQTTTGEENAVVQRRARKAKREAELRSLLETRGPESVRRLRNLFPSFDLAKKLLIIETIGEIGGEEAASALVGWLATDLEGIVQACLRGLASIGPTLEAEKALQELLENSDGHLLPELIDTLALVGSADSISHLEPLSRGLFRPKSIRDAATKAIRSIRHRVAIAPVGALSVSPPIDGGHLSLSDAQGALSTHRSRGPADE